MDVFLIRHAEALDRAAPIDDAHRPLTAHGRRDARKLGKALRKAGVELDAIVTSPLVRAVETAELVAVGLDFDPPLEVAAELGPARDPAKVVKEVLLPRGDLRAVAVVGHQPQLGALLALLLGGAAPPPAKASAIRLRWDGPEAPARFKWVLHAGSDEPSKDLAEVAGD